MRRPFICVLIVASVVAVASADDGFSRPKEPDPVKRTEPIPARYASVSDVALKIEGHAVRRSRAAPPEPVDKEQPGAATGGTAKPDPKWLIHSFQVRVINPTSEAIFFTGYDETSPLWFREYWAYGDWHDDPMFGCGTGHRKCTIPPGRSAVFTVAAVETLFPVRFDINYHKPSSAAGSFKVVYTERLEVTSYLEESGKADATKSP